MMKPNYRPLYTSERIPNAEMGSFISERDVIVVTQSQKQRHNGQISRRHRDSLLAPEMLANQCLCFCVDRHLGVRPGTETVSTQSRHRCVDDCRGTV